MAPTGLLNKKHSSPELNNEARTPGWLVERSCGLKRNKRRISPIARNSVRGFHRLG